MRLTGHCLCGQVSYEATGKPAFTGVCHCTHCQRQSGSAFSIIVGVPSAELTVQGEMKVYVDHNDNGQPVQRCFCPTCGSPILSTADSTPGITFIKAGTLDDTASLEPRFSIWCKSAQPWLKLDTAGRNFDTNIPARADKAR